MEKNQHAFHELFAQLGLPCDAQSIAQFVQTHHPLPGGVDLPDADFWSPAQAVFLRESLLQDNGWAQQVDALSQALREP
jgi:hypothetical protein